MPNPSTPPPSSSSAGPDVTPAQLPAPAPVPAADPAQEAVAAAVQANQAAMAVAYAQMREAIQSTKAVLSDAMVQAQTTEAQGTQEMQRSMQAALDATRAAIEASARSVLAAYPVPGKSGS